MGLVVASSYGIVVEGEITLLLDDGSSTVARVGDVFVQRCAPAVRGVAQGDPPQLTASGHQVDQSRLDEPHGKRTVAAPS